MKRILVGLVIGLLLLEAGRRLYHPADEAAAAGSAAYRAGDFAAAEARFHEAEREAADKAPAAYNRAAALYRLRRFDDADHSYQRSADDQALHAARADYDRGNCAFSDACKDEGIADSELLQKAAREYEACLAREGSTSDAGSLFADARHNLELTRLILSEFAEKEKPTAEGDKPEPDQPEVAKDDPFAPSNSANPPEGEAQNQQADGAKDGAKKEQKPPETVAKNDADRPPTHACKDCERGGCPTCKKKPGKGPGPNEAPRKGDGPKPNPGKDENGKAPGQAKSQNEVEHSDPGPGKKGKAGEGGKPNPNGKNGVGHTTEPGTGPVDESFKTTKKGDPSKGQMVGPDGVMFERKDGPKQESKGGKGGGGDGSADEMKDPQPGGKDGAPHGAPGEGDKPRVTKDQPPPPDIDKLFKPGSPQPNDRNDAGKGGTTAGSGRGGSGQFGKEADETDGSGDPRERAAVRRLRQAVQRIEKSRDARPAPQPGKGEAPDPDRRRDW
jgi:hypothetical protein